MVRGSVTCFQGIKTHPRITMVIQVKTAAREATAATRATYPVFDESAETGRSTHLSHARGHTFQVLQNNAYMT